MGVCSDFRRVYEIALSYIYEVIRYCIELRPIIYTGIEGIFISVAKIILLTPV